MHLRSPLSPGTVEDLLHERGFEVSHEAGRFWLPRFVPAPAADASDTNGPVSPASCFSAL